VGAFVLPSSLLVWYLIKKTVGIRVSLEEEITGLDIGEHGNTAYPEFISRKPAYAAIVNDDSVKTIKVKEGVVNEAY